MATDVGPLLTEVKYRRRYLRFDRLRSWSAIRRSADSGCRNPL